MYAISDGNSVRADDISGDGRDGVIETARERSIVETPPVVPDVRRHDEQRQSVVGSGRLEAGNTTEKVKA